jgi:protein-L-isoaspartate O-methyltransferase
VLARHVLWAMPDTDAVPDRWTQLLKPGGALMLVEGHWHTGAGRTGAQAEQAVRRHRAEVTVVPLGNPLLWGGPITGERYLLLSPR